MLEHYSANPAAAKQLLSVGEAPLDDSLPPERLAAWTMIASALSNSDDALNK
jgi:hypothetical protein